MWNFYWGSSKYHQIYGLANGQWLCITILIKKLSSKALESWLMMHVYIWNKNIIEFFSASSNSMKNPEYMIIICYQGSFLELNCRRRISSPSAGLYLVVNFEFLNNKICRNTYCTALHCQAFRTCLQSSQYNANH